MQRKEKHFSHESNEYKEPKDELGTDCKFDFEKVKEHLSTLENPNEKIKHLVEVKTDYLQTNEVWNIEPVTFDKKCDLEIRKIKTLKSLESNESSE